jgi:hypothetical protein
MLLECFQIAESAIFINEGVLEVTASLLGILDCSAHQAGAWHILDVDLDPLAWILHLFVLFGNILGIWQLDSPLFSPPQNPIEA